MLILSDVTFSILKIWAAMLLLLTYGLFSPLAAIGIGANVVSRATLLRGRICRYYHLQKRSTGDVATVENGEDGQGVSDSNDEDNDGKGKHEIEVQPEIKVRESSIVKDDETIESICANTHDCLHAAIWPGLIISTSLFSLYVLDMAYDTDEPSLAVPLALQVLTILLLPVSAFSYYRQKADLEDRVTRNRLEIMESEMTETEKTSDDATENPLQK